MENQPTNPSYISSTNPTSINQSPLLPQTKTNLMVLVLLTFFISAVVFGLGGYYFGTRSSISQNVGEYIQTSPTHISSSTIISSPTAIISSPTAAPIVSNSTVWETYSNSEYSFTHPNGLISNTAAAGTAFESISFKLIGPKQKASGKTQTSIFDGYSFIVTKIGLTSQKTAEQWATEDRSNSKENCGSEIILSDMKPITIGKASGVQYSVKNCIGDYTTSYISNGKNVYQITQLYVGEPADQSTYEQITNQIFNSLKFF